MLSDKNKIYFKKENMEKLFKSLKIEEVGLYMTIRSFDYEKPDGIEKTCILNSSADEHSDIMEILNSLERKGFINISEGKIKVIR